MAKIEDGEGWKTPKDGDWLEISVASESEGERYGKMATVWEKGLADEEKNKKAAKRREGLFFQLNLKKRKWEEDDDNDDASNSVPFGVHLALQFFKKGRDAATFGSKRVFVGTKCTKKQPKRADELYFTVTFETLGSRGKDL